MPKGVYDRTNMATQATRRYIDINEWTADEWAKLHPDKGCYINPIPWGCLTCPLPACKYDMPNTRRLTPVPESG